MYACGVVLSFFRDNGLKAIENLMEKKGKFDYILLETTGLADPGISDNIIYYISPFLYRFQLCGLHSVFMFLMSIIKDLWNDTFLNLTG